MKPVLFSELVENLLPVSEEWISKFELIKLARRDASIFSHTIYDVTTVYTRAGAFACAWVSRSFVAVFLQSCDYIRQLDYSCAPLKFHLRSVPKKNVRAVAAKFLVQRDYAPSLLRY